MGEYLHQKHHPEQPKVMHPCLIIRLTLFIPIPYYFQLSLSYPNIIQILQFLDDTI